MVCGSGEESGGAGTIFGRGESVEGKEGAGEPGELMWVAVRQE